MLPKSPVSANDGVRSACGAEIEKAAGLGRRGPALRNWRSTQSNAANPLCPTAEHNSAPFRGLPTFRRSQVTVSLALIAVNVPLTALASVPMAAVAASESNEATRAYSTRS